MFPLKSISLFFTSTSNFGKSAFKFILGDILSILTFGKLPLIFIFGILESILRFGTLVSRLILLSLSFKSNFGKLPFISTFGTSALISYFGTSPFISISGFFISKSAFGKFPFKSISGNFVFPFKLTYPDGIFISGDLIFTSWIFWLISISFFLISISISGFLKFTSRFGIFNFWSLIFPSTFILIPFMFGFFNSGFPGIIPEKMISSFLPLIFISGGFTFGIFPSKLIFFPLIFGFFILSPSTFGDFIFKLAEGTSNSGGLNLAFKFLFPLISTLRLGSIISSLLEPFKFISGCSIFIFGDFISISGLFIL